MLCFSSKLNVICGLGIWVWFNYEIISIIMRNGWLPCLNPLFWRGGCGVALLGRVERSSLNIEVSCPTSCLRLNGSYILSTVVLLIWLVLYIWAFLASMCSQWLLHFHQFDLSRVFFLWVYCVPNGHFMCGTTCHIFGHGGKTLKLGIATLVQHHQHGYYKILQSQGSTKHILVEQLGSDLVSWLELHPLDNPLGVLVQSHIARTTSCVLWSQCCQWCHP